MYEKYFKIRPILLHTLIILCLSNFKNFLNYFSAASLPSPPKHALIHSKTWLPNSRTYNGLSVKYGKGKMA